MVKDTRQQLGLESNFSLIETMLWTPESGFAYETLHLARLSQSVKALGFTEHDLPSLRVRLQACVQDLCTPQRVRTLYHPDGTYSVTPTEYTPTNAPWQVVLSAHRLSSDSLWLRHKTTNRHLYDTERKRIQDYVDEVIFLNERDEVCEGAITNIFVQAEGTLLTPPVSCGVLPGVLRAHLLQTGQAREVVLTLSDLQGRCVYVGNALRGLIAVDSICGVM